MMYNVPLCSKIEHVLNSRDYFIRKLREAGTKVIQNILNFGQKRIIRSKNILKWPLPMSKMFCWRFISTRSGNLSLANNGRKNWHDSVEHIYQISFGIKSFLLLLYKILTIQMIVVIWRVFVLLFEISAPTADLNFMHFTFLSSNHSHDYTFEIIRSGVRIKMKIVLKNRR